MKVNRLALRWQLAVVGAVTLLLALLVTLLVNSSTGLEPRPASDGRQRVPISSASMDEVDPLSLVETAQASESRRVPDVQDPTPSREESVVESLAGLVVRVVGLDGQSRAGAWVAIHGPVIDPQSLIQRHRFVRGPFGLGVDPNRAHSIHDETTGASGVVSFLEYEGAEGVLVRGDDDSLAWHRLEGGESEVTVELPAVGVVSGRVLLDGAAPDSALTVVVDGFEDPAATLSPGAVAILDGLGSSPGRLVASTDADGAFTVEGVPLGGPVTLSAEGPYRRPNGGRASWTVPVDGPPLELSLRRAPTVLIYLTPLDAAAVGGAVDLDCLFVRSAATRVSTRARSTVGGTVELERPPGRTSSLRLIARDEQGRTLGRRTYSSSELENGWDLSLPVPERADPVRLRVVDTSGRKLSDAHIRYDGREYTAPNGELGLEVSPARGRLLVGAPRHAAREFDASELSGPEFIARLELANSIELSVHSALDLAAHGVGVDVTDGLDSWTPGARLGGAPPRELDAEGHWSAFDLPAGKSLTLALRDRWGHTLYRGWVVLDTHGAVQLEWEVHDAPMVLAGRVFDPDGDPIAGAKLGLGVGLRGHQRTNEFGEYSIEDVFDYAAELSIDAPGFVARTLEPGAALMADDHVLEPARTLRVRVESASLEALYFESEGRRWRAAEAAPGLWRFDDIPRVPGVLVAPGKSGSESVDGQSVSLTWIVRD